MQVIVEYLGGDFQEVVFVFGVRSKVLIKSIDMRIINLIDNGFG